MSSRELATFILIGVALGAACFNRGIRSSLADVPQLLLHPKILVPLMTYTGWIAVVIWQADRLGVWSNKVLGATIIWFLFSGLVLFGRLINAGKEEHFFRRAVLETVGLGALFEFLVSIKSLPLWGELLLQPILIFLVGMQVVATMKKETARAGRVLQVVQGVIALWLIGISVADATRHWHIASYREQLWQNLALPIWLTLLALPLIYLFALYAEYEGAFINLRPMTSGPKPRWYSRAALMIGLGGEVRLVHQFTGYWGRQVSEGRSFRTAYAQVKAFKESIAERETEERRRIERLERNAGVQGVDESGQRLDQREFQETKDALMKLSYSHMGWYRQRGRYRADLLEVLGIGGSFFPSLPEEHGIEMRVRKDGKAWYAWRRTVTGWVFAIGASKGPPDQWLYDGPEPPIGFPGKDRAWGEGPLGTNSPNW